MEAIIDDGGTLAPIFDCGGTAGAADDLAALEDEGLPKEAIDLPPGPPPPPPPLLDLDLLSLFDFPPALLPPATAVDDLTFDLRGASTFDLGGSGLPDDFGSDLPDFPDLPDLPDLPPPPPSVLGPPEAEDDLPAGDLPLEAGPVFDLFLLLLLLLFLFDCGAGDGVGGVVSSGCRAAILLTSF